MKKENILLEVCCSNGLGGCSSGLRVTKDKKLYDYNVVFSQRALMNGEENKNEVTDLNDELYDSVIKFINDNLKNMTFESFMVMDLSLDVLFDVDGKQHVISNNCKLFNDNHEEGIYEKTKDFLLELNLKAHKKDMKY